MSRMFPVFILVFSLIFSLASIAKSTVSVSQRFDYLAEEHVLFDKRMQGYWTSGTHTGTTYSAEKWLEKLDGMKLAGCTGWKVKYLDSNDLEGLFDQGYIEDSNANFLDALESEHRHFLVWGKKYATGTLYYKGHPTSDPVSITRGESFGKSIYRDHRGHWTFTEDLRNLTVRGFCSKPRKRKY